MAGHHELLDALFRDANTPQNLSGKNGRLQEASILHALLTKLHTQEVYPMTAGGSPAYVLRITTTQEEKLVLKYLSGDIGLVDGHDLHSFRLKIAQTRYIYTHAPRLRPFYFELSQEFHGANWSAYCMPFYEGYQLTSLLTQTPPHTSLFFKKLAHILTILIEHGYMSGWIEAPTNFFARVHLSRLRCRLWLLHKHLPQQMLSAPVFIINGHRCLAAPLLLDIVQADSELLQRLQPQKLYFPVHGDANLGNFILDCQASQASFPFKVLDPRGTLDYWDPIYDFAKMLFSLSSFDPAMRSGFTIRCTPSPNVAYEVGLRDDFAHTYSGAALHFLDFLDSVDACKTLLQKEDPHWRSRLLFSHAFHMLAEAACRLSDRKNRMLAGRRDSCGPVHEELATGLYLIGTLALNQLFQDYKNNRPPLFSSAFTL